MKEDDLFCRRLSALTVPEPDPGACDRALAEATKELQASLPHRAFARRARHIFPAVPRWTLAAGAAAVAFFITATVHFSHRGPVSGPPDPLAAERVLLLQMEALFGQQLDAVIEGPDDAPSIRLAADPVGGVRPGLDQPVLVQFRRTDGGTVRVLSYSGRTVCVMLRGQQVCFEPLVTGRGEVLLSGGTFCWVPGQTSGGWNGYQVSARPLPPS